MDYEQIKLNEREQDQLLKCSQSDFEAAKSYRARLEGDVKDGRAQYEEKFSKRTIQRYGKNLVYYPKTFSVVQRKHSEILGTFFQNRKRTCRISAANVKDQEDVISSKIADPYVNHVFINDFNFYEILRDTSLNALLDGLAWVKGCISEDVRTVIDGETGEEKQVVVGITHKFIPYQWEDIFWDPKATKWDELTYVIYEKDTTLLELIENSVDMEYVNLDMVYTEIGKSLEDNEGESSDHILRQPIHIREFYGWYNWQDPVNVMTLFKKNKLDEIKKQFVVFTTCNDNKVLIRQPYKTKYVDFDGEPVMNFFPVIVVKEQNKLQGRAQPKILKSIQTTMNGLINQKLKSIRRALDLRLLIAEDAGVNLEQLKTARDGGPLIAKKITEDKIREFKFNSPDFSADREMQELDVMSQEATGVTPYNSGMVKAGMHKTKGGLEILTEESMKRMSIDMSNINETMIVPMIKFVMWNAARYELPENVLKIIGEKQDPQNPFPPLMEVFNHKFNVDIETGVGVSSRPAQIEGISVALSQIEKYVQTDPDFLGIALSMLQKLLPLLGVQDQDAELERLISQMKAMKQAAMQKQMKNSGAGQAEGGQQAIPMAGGQ